MGTKRRPSATWICTRRFVARARGKTQIAVGRISLPVRRGKVWICSFVISNIGMRCPIDAVGEDGMQALILALEGMLTMIRKHHSKWRWIYGKRGDVGIPVYVPLGFGKEFSDKLEGMIDKEIEALGAAAEKRHNAAVARARSQ